MKKSFVLIFTMLLMLSCTATKESGTARAESRKEKKLADQAQIKEAVESRKFIIKLNRMYFSYGGLMELIPRANFIIIDGDRAIINTAYLGRQYDIKPIVAINMRGRAVNYAQKNNESKGNYEIQLRVDNGGANAFELNITISRNGYCDASIHSLKIDYVRYSGYLVPITDKVKNTRQEEGIAI